MQSAGAVGANFAIPAIAIARNPAVEMLRDEVNSGCEKQPGNQVPAGQSHTDACPGFNSGVNVSAEVHGLHKPHGFIEIDLRKPGAHAGVVKVHKLDAATRVKAADAGHAGAAQIAAPIVKYSKLCHRSPNAGARPKKTAGRLVQLRRLHSNKQRG